MTTLRETLADIWTFHPVESLIVVLAVIAMGSLNAVREQRDTSNDQEWEQFAAAHHCVVATQEIGTGTLAQPQLTGWKCDDDVLYVVGRR